MTRWLAGCLAGAVLVAGCSSGPPVKTSIGPGAPFCGELAAFRDQIVALGSSADQSLAALQELVRPARDQLAKLQSDAPATDTVGGHLVKADLQTELDVVQGLLTQLSSAVPTDPAAVSNALAAVQARQGAALTQVTGRLDAYTKSACKVGVAATPPTSTTAGPAAPPAPVGPAAPTTVGPLSGASTGVGAPVGTGFAPTSTPGPSTPSPPAVAP